MEKRQTVNNYFHHHTARFIACYKATISCVVQNLVLGLYAVDFISNFIKHYYDNASGTLQSNNNKRSSGSKHIEIKYMVIRNKIKEG